MSQAKNYLAMRTVEPDDKVDHGVKGMHWGIHRSRTSLKIARAKRAETSSEGSAEKSAPKAPYEGETSSARYARLAAQAKGGGASNFSEPDLKFFNSRTEALAKVAKMNESKPGWLGETTKAVAQNAAKNTMQSITDAVAKKYISGPIIDGLTGGKSAEVEGLATVAKAVAKPMVEAVKAQSTSPTVTAPRPPGMTQQQSLDYLRKHTGTSTKPKDYSPSGNYDLFKQLKAEGVL